MNGTFERFARLEGMMFLLVLCGLLWEGVRVGLLTLIGVLSLVILMKRWQKPPAVEVAAERMLETDALTGLYTNRKMQEELRAMISAARERGQGVTVLHFDIDDFKPINHHYGQDVGDDLLRHVVSVLREAVGFEAILGRYAGDEFVLVLPNVSTPAGLETAERVQERLSQAPFRFDRYEEALPITLSVGVAQFPDDGQSAGELLEKAVLSTEQAKREGSSKIQRVPSYMRIDEQLQGSGSHGLEGHLLSLKDKDTYTLQHSEDVAGYALVLADELHLTPQIKRELQSAGIFHDIGKILVPDTVLKKPGRLTDEEYDQMKRHVVLSHEILLQHYSSETMRQAVICHHERFDGRGYPLGLKGTEIPLAGRILAIADAFSAMTLDRSYRKSKTMPEGLAEIRRCAGTQFDPELAEMFCLAVEKQLEGAQS